MDKFYQNSLGRILLRILFVIVLIVCFSFCIKDRKINIKGNWYFFDPESIYNECYIEDDSVIMFYNLIAGKGIINYTILSDSLIIYNSETKNSFYITYASPKQIIITKNDSIEIIWRKINQKIETWKISSENISLNNEFSEQFKDRLIKKCSK